MPPHVTLIYPFTDDSQLVPSRIREVRAVIGRFRSFEFSLAEARRFDNLPHESYVWLAPTPALPFVELVEALAEAFPEHPPFGGAFPTIVPHLTVAASTDDTKLRHVEASLSSRLPIEATATTVSIMEQVDGTWRLVADAPLAQS